MWHHLCTFLASQRCHGCEYKFKRTQHAQELNRTELVSICTSYLLASLFACFTVFSCPLTAYVDGSLTEVRLQVDPLCVSAIASWAHDCSACWSSSFEQPTHTTLHVTDNTLHELAVLDGGVFDLATRSFTVIETADDWMFVRSRAALTAAALSSGPVPSSTNVRLYIPHLLLTLAAVVNNDANARDVVLHRAARVNPPQGMVGCTLPFLQLEANVFQLNVRAVQSMSC